MPFPESFIRNTSIDIKQNDLVRVPGIIHVSLKKASERASERAIEEERERGREGEREGGGGERLTSSMSKREMGDGYK